MNHRQLILDLPARDARGRADFLPGASNTAALEAIERWRDWPGGALLVVGPKGSGRSHLARIWMEESAALLVDGADLPNALEDLLAANRPVAVDDADRVAGYEDSEEALFHLLNHARQSAIPLLLIARETPGTWGLTLPDLESRLLAIPPVRVERPDDALLYMVLAKLCDERQLAVTPDVLDYLVPRIDRSLRAARDVVATMDGLALSLHRKPTRALAAEALVRLQEQ